MASYATYARFYSEAQAQDLAAFLTTHHIAYKLEKDREVLDKIYVGETLDPMVNLRIEPGDFARVNELVVNEFTVDLAQVPKEYYLFTFSKEELLDVVQGNDWNYFDRALAKKILSDKNIHIHSANNTHTAPVFESQRIQPAMLALEYALAVVFAYMGIVIGLATLAAYKTSPTGERLTIYDASSRVHAGILIGIGVVRTTIFLIIPVQDWPHAFVF